MTDPALQLYAERRYVEAADAFARRCARAPGDADAWLGQGQSLLALGRWADAWTALRRARALAVDARGRAVVDARRADVAIGLGDPSLAEACYRASLAARPDAGVRGRLGIFLLNQSRLDEAEVELDLADAGSGGRLPEVAAALATLRTQRGEAEAALLALRRAPLEVPAVALAKARACLQLRRAREALPAVDAALRVALPAHAWLLHHARASLLDQLDDVDGAAEAWAAMHAARGARPDPAALRARADRILTHWVPTVAPPAPAGAPRPAFVVGLPRSGTSLVEQALAAHPLVHAAGEREELRQLADRLGAALGAPWPECTPDLPRAAASGARAWRAAVGSAGHVVVTDKMPENLLRLGLAAQLFPDARAVWVRRGLLDTLLSCWQQPFGPAYGWTGSWEGLAAQAEAYEALGRAWVERAPLPVFTLRYEALVRAPEPTLRALVDHLGLPWDPDVAHPEAVDRVVRTASIHQVRAPIHAGGIGRWRRYARVLEPLRALLDRAGLDPEASPEDPLSG